jgi:hypothetical protein
MRLYQELHKRIHVYLVQQDFNAPLKCDEGKIKFDHVELKSGDFILTINNRVYVPDDQAEGRKEGMPEDTMSQALFNKEFIDLNTKIFKPI